MRKMRRGAGPNFTQWIALEPELMVNLAHVERITFPGYDEAEIEIRLAGAVENVITVDDPGHAKSKALIQYLLRYGAGDLVDNSGEEGLEYQVLDSRDRRDQRRSVRQERREVRREFSARWEELCEQQGWNPHTGKPWDKTE